NVGVVLVAEAERPARAVVDGRRVLALEPRSELRPPRLVAAAMPAVELERERAANGRHDVVAGVELAIVDARAALRRRLRLGQIVEAGPGRQRRARTAVPRAQLEAAREIEHVVSQVAAELTALVGVELAEGLPVAEPA